jgi:hypothetical protein
MPVCEREQAVFAKFLSLVVVLRIPEISVPRAISLDKLPAAAS